MPVCVAEMQLPLEISNSIIGLPLKVPALADFYSETGLCYGLARKINVDFLDRKNQKNPWRTIKGWWVMESFVIHDQDQEYISYQAEYSVPLPSGRVIRHVDLADSPAHQFRQDVFCLNQYPSSIIDFDQMIDELIQPLLVTPQLPTEDSPTAVSELAELLYLAMAYDNEPAGIVVRTYINMAHGLLLEKSGYIYDYLATRSYGEVRQLIDQFRQAARGRMIGQPRLLPEDVDTVKAVIRSSLPLQLK